MRSRSFAAPARALPAPGRAVRVLDADGAESPLGEIGEIYLRSPSYGGYRYLGDAPRLRGTDDGVAATDLPNNVLIGRYDDHKPRPIRLLFWLKEPKEIREVWLTKEQAQELVLCMGDLLLKP